MWKDAEEYVRTCLTCKMTNDVKSQKAAAGKSHNYPSLISFLSGLRQFLTGQKCSRYCEVSIPDDVQISSFV